MAELTHVPTTRRVPAKLHVGARRNNIIHDCRATTARPHPLLHPIQHRATDTSTVVVMSEAADITSSAPRRRSGRVTKKPEQFHPETSPAGSAKRKRSEENDTDTERDEPTSEDEPSQSSEGEPDEEELRERRRTKKRAPAAKKPPQKKPKTNGEIVGLAIRPATNAPKKPKKPRKAPIRKSAIVEDADGGLYGKFSVGR